MNLEGRLEGGGGEAERGLPSVPIYVRSCVILCMSLNTSESLFPCLRVRVCVCVT